jgi:hypothetical protein
MVAAMGSDEVALVQLRRERRGELEPEDLSGHLIVQLGNATEDLNRRSANEFGQTVTQVQRIEQSARWPPGGDPASSANSAGLNEY